MPSRFVAFGTVDPNRAAHAQVAGPHGRNFAASHASEPLELNHRGHLGRNVIKHCIHKGIWDRSNWRRFPRIASASTQSGYGLQSVKDAGRDELVFDGPFEDV